MKKKKLNLSKDGIKNFFFRHVEKLFFGLACGLILLFVWLGFKSPAFKATTPKEMLSKTQQAETFINDDSHWNKIQDYRVADTEAAKRISEAKAVDPTTYPYRQISGTAVFTLEPRRDPALDPVKEFQVQHIRGQVAQAILDPNEKEKLEESGLNALPDSGLQFPPNQKIESFMMRPGQFGNNVKLETFDAVVGMALIDHKKQMQNFKENFQYQRGYDPVRDIPEYSAIEVQRKTDDSEWEPITEHVYVVSNYLGNPAKELADEKYISPSITLPIPPLVGQDYRKFALLDEIPTVDVFADDKEEKDKKLGNDESSSSERDIFGSRKQSGTKDEEDQSEDDKSEDEKPDAKASDSEDAEIEAPIRLVRFYDLQTKAPGKTYSYRVRVWIKDPNNPDAVNADIASSVKDSSGRGNVGLGGGGNQADSGPGGGGGGSSAKAKPKTPLKETDLAGDVRQRIKQPKELPAGFENPWSDPLEAMETALKEQQEALKKAYQFSLPTEWVECAQPIKISGGFETFVAGPVNVPPVVRVRGGEFSFSEPSFRIVANSFQEKLQAFVPAQTETLRGSLLNFNDVAFVLDPLTWAIKEVFDGEDSRGVKQGQRFETNAVVLDIMGGQKIGRGDDEFETPGECLIMDRNFRILLHNEVQDTTAWRHANFFSPENQQFLDEANKKKDDEDEDDDNGG